MGNALSFLVLHKGGSQNTGSYLLKADHLFLTVYMLVDINILIHDYLFQTAKYREHIPVNMWQYLWPIFMTIHMCSIWMVVLVAGNRYVAVCHPLVAAMLCTKRIILFHIMIMTCAVFAFNVPRFFELLHAYLYLYLYAGVFYCTFVYAWSC